jgi:hypothetical protein
METIDADNGGRIETRPTAVNYDVDWLRERHDWPGMNAVAMVESTREIAGKMEPETRYYITSSIMLVHLLGPMIRSHWAIENSLHRVVDMVFRDDVCRVRTHHAPAREVSVHTGSRNPLSLFVLASIFTRSGDSTRPGSALTSPRSNTWPAICSEDRPARTRCDYDGRSQPGTMTSLPALSGHDSFTQFA